MARGRTKADRAEKEDDEVKHHRVREHRGQQRARGGLDHQTYSALSAPCRCRVPERWERRKEGSASLCGVGVETGGKRLTLDPQRDLAEEEQEETATDPFVLMPDGVGAEGEDERGAARPDGVGNCEQRRRKKQADEHAYTRSCDLQSRTLGDPGDAHTINLLNCIQIDGNRKDVQDHANPANEVKDLWRCDIECSMKRWKIWFGR